MNQATKGNQATKASKNYKDIKGSKEYKNSKEYHPEHSTYNIFITGREKVGKTRIYSALCDKKYRNMPTIDIHACPITKSSIVFFDTPPANTLSERHVRQFQVDVFWIIIDGSLPPNQADIEIINHIRKLNKPFEILICFGQQYLNEIQAALPRNTVTHILSTAKALQSLKKQLILQYPVKIETQETHNESNEEEDDFSEFDNDENESNAQELEKQEPIKQEPLKWIVVGRENAGKSTLVNQLVGEERVVVSDKPGTTRESVDLVTNYEDLLVNIKDTAGVKRLNAEYVKRLLEKRALVIFMIDGAAGLTHHDKSLLGRITTSGLSCIIVLNKVDLPNFDKDVEKELNHYFKHLPIIKMSALKGSNLKALIKKAKEVEEHATTKISTSKITQWAHNNKHLFHGVKVKYGCHVSTSPFQILLFITPAKPDPTKISQLKNMLYKHFALEGVCFQLITRSPRSAKRAALKPQWVKDNKKHD